MRRFPREIPVPAPELLAQAAPAGPAAPGATPAPSPAAGPAAAPQPGSSAPGAPPPNTVPVREGEGTSFIVMMLLMLGILYFFMFRPQMNKEKQRVAMLDKIKKNDRVLTSGGMYGTVHSVKDNVVVLKVDEDRDIKVRVAKSAVTQVLAGEDEKGEEGKNSKS